MERNEELEIEFPRLLNVVLRKLWLVILSAVMGAVLFLLVTDLAIKPEYQSSALFYVNNNALSVGEKSVSVSSSDLYAARSLVYSYRAILESRATLVEVIKEAGVHRSVEEVREMLYAGPVDITEIFQVVVTSHDPEEAYALAEGITKVLPRRISYIIEGTSSQVVDSAVLASLPSAPGKITNAVTGLLFGAVFSVSILVLLEAFDTRIRREEHITQISSLPILTTVPDMSLPSKGGYYGYGMKKREFYRSHSAGKQQQGLVGGEMPFSAEEAYKRLRTKVQFSFTGEPCCRVIGVSSALAGEGKSLTSVNLAYSLAELNKRVLLIDCDMRRPSVSAKLPIGKTPGLSNFLAGQLKAGSVFQRCNLQGNEDAFVVVAAGDLPPNPLELLSSERMRDFLNRLRDMFDYVVLDLPPVGEVSDAMAAGEWMDGMLMVVRQDYCDRRALKEAVCELESVNCKLLGVVYNFARENGNSGAKYARRYRNRQEDQQNVSPEKGLVPSAPDQNVS